MIKLPRIGRSLLPAARAQRVGRLIALCALVGVGAGLGAICFELLTAFLKHALLDGIAGYRPAAPAGDVEIFEATRTPFSSWKLALLPIFGGLAGGALVFWLAPEAEGHGTDAAIDAYHHRRGRIRAIVPLVKTVASALTLGAGGSAGREGPIAQIGAGLGSILGGALRLHVQERRVLMIAGLAAGVGAIFRAPLASALFAAEVLYREMDMEFEVIVPAVIASIIAYSVFTLTFGGVALFATPLFTFDHPLELIPYTVLALSVAAGAKLFVTTFHGVHDLFARLRWPRVIKPALGGVFVGAVALVLPEAIGSGYGLVQKAIGGQVPLALLITVVIGKMLTTSFTIGSGQSGGVFGPAIVVGGLLGGAVGLIANAYMPDLSPPPGAFVIVGMAGFFAGAANTPISTIIMVSEMTGSYRLLVPSMWVSIIAFLLVRRSTLYRHQLARRSDSPVHLGEMMAGVLERMSVAEALGDGENEPVVTVRESTPLGDLVALFSETHHACFPIVDASGKLLGTVDDKALRQALVSDWLVQKAVVAADLIEQAPRLRPAESLHAAMRKMVASGSDELVVVSDEDESRVEGMLSRRDLIAAYHHRIQRDRQDWGAPPSSRGASEPTSWR